MANVPRYHILRSIRMHRKSSQSGSSVTRCWNYTLVSYPNSPTFVKIETKAAFSLKLTSFKIALKVTKYLYYFYKKICCKKLSKIAHSGHAVWVQRILRYLIEASGQARFLRRGEDEGPIVALDHRVGDALEVPGPLANLV